MIYLAFEPNWYHALMLGAALAIFQHCACRQSARREERNTGFSRSGGRGHFNYAGLICHGADEYFAGVTPSPWALLIFALPLLQPLLFKLLNLTGHDDLQILFGVLLAVVLGGGGFHLVGLKL